MMLHRHFDSAKSNRLTTLAVLTGEKNGEDLNNEVLPEVETEEKPKRGRKKKTEE